MVIWISNLIPRKLKTLFFSKFMENSGCKMSKCTSISVSCRENYLFLKYKNPKHFRGLCIMKEAFLKSISMLRKKFDFYLSDPRMMIGVRNIFFEIAKYEYLVLEVYWLLQNIFKREIEAIPRLEEFAPWVCSCKHICRLLSNLIHQTTAFDSHYVEDFPLIKQLEV